MPTTDLGVYQPTYRKRPQRLKKDGTPYKPRKGWGPYRSVPNERAVAFNLQLDVQSLQQEVQNMTALRDILRAQVLTQSHSPEGSLVHLVKEYFHVFQGGSVINNAGDPSVINARYQEQRTFMYSVVDADVDVGNGVRGPEHMMYQMDMYSTLIRWLNITMHSFDVVEAEGSVVITANATLRFKIVRATIEKIFPHIMGEEKLVSQLLGQEAEPTIRMTFYFNSEGKCCRFDADMDFLGAFASMVKDVAIVDLLFRRALIADNCQLGMIDELPEPEKEEKQAPPSANPTLTKDLEDERNALVQQIDDLRNASSIEPEIDEESPSSQSTRGLTLQDVQTSCLQLVRDYYSLFSNGYQFEDRTRNFLLNRFVSTTTQSQRSCRIEAIPKSNCTTAEYMVERWRSLSECFWVVGFHQKAVVSAEYHHHVGMCAINSSARYTLRITSTTLQVVFPHILGGSPLYNALLEEILVVPSQIYFSFEANSGCICRVEERMDFVVALAKLIPNGQDLQFVLAQAKLVLDGVSYRSERGTWGTWPEESTTAAAPTTRSMHISGILC